MKTNPSRKPDVTPGCTADNATLALSAEEKRNFKLGVINGALFTTGLTFIGTSTVIPAFITELSGSQLAVGIAAAILLAGYPLPQMFIARYTQRHASIMRFYRFGGVMRSLCLLLTVVSTFMIGSSAVNAALLVFMLGLAGYSLGGGIGGVAFTEMVARTVPSWNRSSFFAQRMFWGGIGSLGAGWIVRQVLASPELLAFPINYRFLFACAWVCVVIAITSYACVREPELPPVATTKESFAKYFRNGLRLLSRDKRYTLYLLASTLASSHQMAIPFYSIFILKLAGIGSQSMLGLLIVAQTVGGLASNFIWARLGDQRGSLPLFKGSIIITVLVPATALAVGGLMQFGSDPVRIALAGVVLFVLLGVATTGTGIATLTYLLDISPVSHRTTYIGFTNTYTALYGLYPILGGLVADAMGAGFLFAITLAMQMAAVIAAWRLPAHKVDRPPALMQA